MVLFTIAFFLPSCWVIAWSSVGILVFLTIVDYILLYREQGISADRRLPEKLSNGDQNPIYIYIRNDYSGLVHLRIIDEIPFQFQVRDFNLSQVIGANQEESLLYHLRPTERGEYLFGKLNVFARSRIGLLERRYIFSDQAMIPCYPSFMQLRKYDLLAFTQNLYQHGHKKIRKVGYSKEFEQIREYVQGDDIRAINWKATAKRNSLMINQYQTERSQNIYMIIDKGRVMRMPFHGLSLLDYAINSSLVLSNVILRKEDKAGLMTFSRKVENRIVAERKPAQMGKILETLYNIDTDFKESDFSRLYVDINMYINQRSLIMLYTNFETIDSLYRQLPYLRAIAAKHLLVVVFFHNSEIDSLLNSPALTMESIYDKAIAEKFHFEKKLIIQELRKYNIYSLLTKPEDLTVDSINKYLDIKNRGII